MKYAARTDVGLVRRNNEDSYLIDEMGDAEIFIVADGMGGHNAGEVASLEACRKIDGYIRKNRDKSDPELLEEAVKSANREIFIHASQNEAMSGMGTTVDAVIARGNSLTIAHVGDSSVFSITKTGIEKITKDHSVVGMMLDLGTLTPEEAKKHPQRHYITRAVGTAFGVEVDVTNHSLADGERILMCTDGLTDMASPDEIFEIVSKSASLAEAADSLVNLAKNAGGSDNVTLIIFGEL